jgi:hypothetical protein
MYAPSEWWRSAGAIALVVHTVVTAGMGAAVLGMRRAFRRKTDGAQWKLAAGALLISLIGCATVLFMFRDA